MLITHSLFDKRSVEHETQNNIFYMRNYNLLPLSVFRWTWVSCDRLLQNIWLKVHPCSAISKPCISSCLDRSWQSLAEQQTMSTWFRCVKVFSGDATVTGAVNMSCSAMLKNLSVSIYFTHKLCVHKQRWTLRWSLRLWLKIDSKRYWCCAIGTGLQSAFQFIQL